MSSKLLIAQIPPFDLLEAFALQLNGHDGRINSMQYVKSKCRELARLDPSILVSPAFEDGCHFWMISKTNYFVSAKWRAKFDITVQCKIPVSCHLFESCCKFTVVSRLAPKWNQVGQWLFQGSEFVTTGKVQAVVVNVGVTVEELTFSLSAHKIILNFLQVGDLDVTPIILKKYMSDPTYSVKEQSICSNRCLVLPNFTSAHVYSVSHIFPYSPTFPSYDLLRLHWKKQYGIILPEKQTQFYQVYFRSHPDSLFTYPGCCVIKDQPVVFPSRDTCALVAAFASDVQARMPSLCGQPLKFSGQVLVPSLHLQCASSTTDSTTYPLVQVSQNQKRNNVTETRTVTLPSSQLEGSKTRAVPFVPCFTKSQKQGTSSADCSTAEQRQETPKRGRDQTVPQLPSKRPCFKVASAKSTEEYIPGLLLSAECREDNVQTVPQKQDKGLKPATIMQSTFPNKEAMNNSMLQKINKANVPALKKWLQEKGIKYYSKDKKEKLVRLVVLHVEDTGTQFDLPK